MKLIRKIDEVVGVKFDGTLECLIEMRELFDYKFCNYKFIRNFSELDNKLDIQYVGTVHIGDWVILHDGKYSIYRRVEE